MNAKEYNAAVADACWPQDPAVPVEPAFTDDRGVITNLSMLDIGSVSEIHSVKGSIRANHRHKTDWHYAYVVSGRVKYFSRTAGSNHIPEPRTFSAGSLFFTPPGIEHAMLFPEDTTILTWSRRRRDHESHEADVVRVEFITPDIAKQYL